MTSFYPILSACNWKEIVQNITYLSNAFNALNETCKWTFCKDLRVPLASHYIISLSADDVNTYCMHNRKLLWHCSNICLLRLDGSLIGSYIVHFISNHLLVCLLCCVLYLINVKVMVMRGFGGSGVNKLHDNQMS